MTNEELLPCPFCGGSKIAEKEGETFRWRKMECASCGACCGETRIRTFPPLEPEADAKAVRGAWNTRAELQRRQQPETEAASVPTELVAKWHAEACLAWPEHAAQPWGFTKFSTEYLANKAAAYGRGQSQWVPVSERLPDADVKQVFVWDAGAKRVSACEFPSGWYGMLAHTYITHWMPLPEPPTC